MRWLLAIGIALVLLSFLQPWLEKLGIGRLPGDWRGRLFGKPVFLPFTSTVLLSGLAWVVARLLP